LDTEMVPIQTFDSLLNKDLDFFVGLQNREQFFLSRSVIGCSQHHPLIAQTVESLLINLTNSKELQQLKFWDIVIKSGPVFFSSQVLQFMRRHPSSGVVVLKKFMLSPVEKGQQVTPHSCRSLVAEHLNEED
jgi:hypothetical protein